MTFKTGSPTSTAIKICGVTKTNQAEAIASIGVDAIGIIGVKESPRFVNEVQRRKLFKKLEESYPYLNRVWVIANMSNHQISEGLKGDGIPTVIQLHGEESKDYCQELRKSHPNFKWWKAIRIRSPLDISRAQSYEEHVDALLIDAWSPNELGGTGNRLPLQWVKNTNFQVPWWLAGGICAEWIPEIFNEVSPFGIDASSRLETAPGIKDLQRVRELVSGVKKISS